MNNELILTVQRHDGHSVTYKVSISANAANNVIDTYFIFGHLTNDPKINIGKIEALRAYTLRNLFTDIVKQAGWDFL